MRFLPILLAFAALAAAQPTPVIFDTDIGNDVDDALALAILHALESRGEAELLAVTITKDNPWAARYVYVVDSFYGRPLIPIGRVHNGKTPEDSAMLRVPVERFAPGGFDPVVSDATGLLRQALQNAVDGSVVIVQVGFSTNLARLIATADGRALVARKVRLLSVMAGHFPDGPPEYNVKTDIPSARQVFDEWPTPIVFSGFEIGQALLFPAAAVEHGFSWAPHHPVAEAYRAYMKMPYNRPTWDLTAALYAVRPDAGYFDLSPPGKVSVDDTGRTHFTPDPAGRHRYLILTEAQKARTLEALILLATEPTSRPAN